MTDTPHLNLPARPRILVADDENSMRFVVREVMQREGYEVEEAVNGEEAVQKVREQHFDLVIMDIKMPTLDGMGALRLIKSIRPNLVVVMITAHGSRTVALEAIREGAYDYFTKPFEIGEMRVVVRRALERQALISQLRDLEGRLLDRMSLDRIVGRTDAMQQVYAAIERVITNDVTVLITGESGTGKELVAQAIHYHSARKSKPFVSVNCAAIPENLLESELFGHEKGSFTGAVAAKAGRFEVADGGTIFLDEIGDMPLSLQSKILRVLQEGEVMRVGGRQPSRVDVRVVAATNQDLAKLVDARQFRLDLFYRLNVFPIQLPPLRQRREDIQLLAEHFIHMYNSRLGRQTVGLEPDALEAMLAYSWPGNVRELENTIQRAMIMSAAPMLPRTALPAGIVNAQAASAVVFPLGAGTPSPQGRATAIIPEELINDFSVPLQQKIDKLGEELEVRIIKAALMKANGHRQGTADLLGISRKSLHNKMVKYGLFAERGEEETEG